MNKFLRDNIFYIVYIASVTAVGATLLTVSYYLVYAE